MLASGVGLQKLGTQGEAPSLFPGEDTMLPVQGGEKTEPPKNVRCLHLALTLIFEIGDSESEKCGQQGPEASRTGVEAGAGCGHRYSSGAALMTVFQYRALSFKPREVAFCLIQPYSPGTGW